MAKSHLAFLLMWHFCDRWCVSMIPLKEITKSEDF